jgi:hypothetical protein
MMQSEPLQGGSVVETSDLQCHVIRQAVCMGNEFGGDGVDGSKAHPV